MRNNQREQFDELLRAQDVSNRKPHITKRHIKQRVVKTARAVIPFPPGSILSQLVPSAQPKGQFQIAIQSLAIV